MVIFFSFCADTRTNKLKTKRRQQTVDDSAARDCEKYWCEFFPSVVQL